MRYSWVFNGRGSEEMWTEMKVKFENVGGRNPNMSVFAASQRRIEERAVET